MRSRLPLNRTLPAPAEVLNGGEGKRWTLQGYYGIANAFVHTMLAVLYLLAECEVFPGGFADMSDTHPDFGRFKVLESAKSQGDGFLVPKNTGTDRSLPNIGNMVSVICYSIARATV